MCGASASKDDLGLRAKTLTAVAIGYEHSQPGASGLRYSRYYCIGRGGTVVEGAAFYCSLCPKQFGNQGLGCAAWVWV